MKKLCAVLILFFVFACTKAEQSQDFFIKNAQNETLYVHIDGAENASHHRLAFLQHGLASNMEHIAIQTTKRALLDNGYVVVTFDSRYSLGQSDGEVENVRLSTFVDDLTTVIDWAKQQKFYSEPFAIGGHSLGGASVIEYASLHPQQVNVLLPIAPVVSGQYWEDSCMKYMPDFCKHWKETGFYEYKTADKTAVIPYQLVEDTKSYNALDLAPRIQAKTLLIVAGNDTVINPQNLQELFEVLPSQKKEAIIPESGHNFEHEQNQKDLYQAVFDFVK
jgi:pimeloyl-ACP methyl ester carboxylesterase